MLWYANTMSLDLTQLAKTVEDEIAAYEPPDPADAVGTPLPREWFDERLSRLKLSIVSPFTTEMRDVEPSSFDLVILAVAVVVDDKEGNLVVYDPASKEFVLAVREPDRDTSRGVDLVSSGVRGDLVGCYLSA